MTLIRNLIVLLFLIGLVASIEASELVNVDGLFLETEKMVKTNRGYYVPEGSKPAYNFNLGFDFSDKFGGYTYSRNVVSSTIDQSQFRYVALDSEIGIDTKRGVEIYFRHSSSHMLDASDTSSKFPEENVIGLRFKIIGE